MIYADIKNCPVCKKELKEKGKVGDVDEIYINCEHCGEYAMTREFCDDAVINTTDEQRVILSAFLKSHKDDRLKPYLSNDKVAVPEGFKCYPGCLSFKNK